MVRPEVKKKRRELAAKAVQSRKTLKRMEKVVLHRKHKVDRKNLLAKLKGCQLEPQQLELLHSTSSMQTKGLKRFMSDSVGENGLDENAVKRNHSSIDRAEQCLDASLLIKQRKRRRKGAASARSESSSSSSEDTDAVSTDTEIYYHEEEEEEKRDASVNLHESVDSTPNPANHTASPSQNIAGDSRKLKVDIEQTTALNQPAAAKLRVPAKEVIKREPAVYVQVTRDAQVDEARMKLPIIGEEQNIMETIRYNDIVIVSGETGSGKTTQIPQFLYEAGYALNNQMIGITEPRRVAAVSMSERVGRELNLDSDQVSYQIRFSGNVSHKTKIKFMTDGVLLRECQQDFLLSKYSVIIIDEAHERSVFSDILIGLISRIVPMRAKRNQPLKLVIMSATLRVSDFTDNSFLFRQPPPIISIQARQFPVTVQFAKRTPRNHLHAAYRKVCSIHSKLSKGGILVFVTSQMDVKVLCKKLRQKFPCTNDKPSEKSVKSNGRQGKPIQSPNHSSESSQIVKNCYDLAMENLKEDIQLDEDEEEEKDDWMPHGINRGNSDIADWSDVGSDSDEEDGVIRSSRTPLFCLGLYAMLPLDKQRLVFKSPPEGTRLCVIATNVAETSITIPNIKYVVDTGFEKSKVYDLVTGVSKFVTSWTSKSSAEQRMGRAGRMGPGQCFRLYSSAVFTNDFPEHSEPRILQKPVEDVLLQMKSMNIDNVVNFPFPTRPSLEALKTAERKLVLLGALDDSKSKNARYEEISKTEYSSRPTPLGKAMACFAVGARCSKMIVLSPCDLLPHVIGLVSALTVREMFLEGNKWRELKRKWSGQGSSKLLGDFMVMLRALITSESFQCSTKLCAMNGLRTKAMLEIDKLRNQLTQEINNNLRYPTIDKTKSLKRPSDAQSKILRQLLLTSYCDHVARRLPDGEIVQKNATDGTLEKRKLKGAYECMETDAHVYISPESVLKGSHHEFIVYKELYQGDKKMYMRDVAVIDAEWLPYYAQKLCSFSEPKTAPQPTYDNQLDQITCSRPTTYGSLNWSLGTVDVPMHLVDAGIEIYKYFASFLLAGEVIPWFKKHVDKLLSPPSIMTKPWSKLQPRTSKLLQALVAHNVKSKRDLMRTWKKDEFFLKREYLAWLPESHHQKVTQDWEQLVACR